MRFSFRLVPCFLLIVAMLAISAPADDVVGQVTSTGGPGESNDVVDAQPQLVRIAATVDGSGRIVFTKGKVSYEHKHWDRPKTVYFDGTPWANLDATPAQWADYSSQLDLTRAWIVKRRGRDVIALEHTADGFDLYLSDSPNEAGNYEVTIAIPRRR
jgi:hypothetical protein